jgi:hypothetical protein
MNYMDFFGMNLYPELTDKPLAAVTNLDLVNGWYGQDYQDASTHNNNLFTLVTNAYKIYKIPVMILETGCVPKELGLKDPLRMNAETKNSPVSHHAQYLYVKTAYDVLGACDMVAGIYIWDAFDYMTPFYWLDNPELVSYITNYYGGVFNA